MRSLEDSSVWLSAVPKMTEASSSSLPESERAKRRPSERVSERAARDRPPRPRRPPTQFRCVKKPMNNNLRMSGAIALMLKKSKDRRQHEALEAAFKVSGGGGRPFLLSIFPWRRRREEIAALHALVKGLHKYRKFPVAFVHNVLTAVFANHVFVFISQRCVICRRRDFQLYYRT